MADPASVQVEHPDASVNVETQADGTVVVNLETHRRSAAAKKPDRFGDNLADKLSKDDLAKISQQLLEGIEADVRSRSDWLANYEKGLQLLGLMIEEAASSSDATISKVRHPLLLWSIIKFQAVSQGELLPSDGPAKIEDESDGPDEIAEDLERAFNYYLKTTESDYYPDTDRGIFYMGFGGTIFKKVYRDPILRRPVSRCVFLPDLIVSQDTISLESALRVTHKIEMTRQQVLRYQKMKHWREVDLPAPTQRVTSVEEAESKTVTGIAAQRERQEDWPHTIYECYTTLDLAEYDLGEKDQDEGVELPYRVAIDLDSREILEIRRNWRMVDPTWQPRKHFVMWGMIPAIGFLCLGYLHLLGNHTKALTALERIIIDGGMFANFPSGVRVKGLRIENNQIRPAPGEFPEIETGGKPIQEAIMSLSSLMKGPGQDILALLEGLEKQGEKTAGQVDIQTGEGRTNVPVGTIMAMIEQSTQVMTAIHRRLHQGQREELRLLRELLVEQPELLTIPGTTPKWTKEQLANAALVPASDPNIPAHVHRIMQAVVLETLAKSHPELYNMREVQKRIMDIARINDSDTLLMPPIVMPQQPGAQQDPMAGLQAAFAQAQIHLQNTKQQMDGMLKAKDLETKHLKAVGELALKHEEHKDDMQQRAADRESKETIAAKQASTQHALSAQDAEQQTNLTALAAHYDAGAQAADHAHEQSVQAADHTHDIATMPPPPVPGGPAP